MVDRRELTPEIVDALISPARGEQWIADAKLKGFGIRLWASAKDDGIRYAIRVRDENGVVKRENFDPWFDYFSRRKMLELWQDDRREFKWGFFLDDARRWAKSRIRELKGRDSLAESRFRRRHQLSVAFQTMTLEQMAERVIRRMERQQRKDEYIIQVSKLFWRMSEQNRIRKLMEVSPEALAIDITHPSLAATQSRVLQAFVGQLYAVLDQYHGPAGAVSEAITQQISDLRSKQGVPHPVINKISEADISKFLQYLTNEDVRWREALAIELYFETGAKMRRILKMQWAEIVDNRWYPYDPDEREYWFMGTEILSDEARRILQLAKSRLQSEGGASAYVFPELIDRSIDRPIANIRRYWRHVLKKMGWIDLPLSHVVRRYRRRTTPSYIYMYSYLFVPMERNLLNPEVVSKLSNQKKFNQ